MKHNKYGYVCSTNDLLLYRVYINSIVIQQDLSQLGWGLCYAIDQEATSYGMD